ncbi:MAG: hypothetical protein AB7L66_05235 [Gemmatimonadales bacterium]
MAIDWIVLELRAAHCRAEAWLNDIPLARVGFLQTTSEARPVNEFATQGRNELRLVVNPGPRPSVARVRTAEPARAPDAAAIATLVRYRQGAVSGDGSGQVLATAAWTAREDGEPEPFPAEAVATADVTLPLGPWGFSTAPPLALGTELEAEVADVIGILSSGLAAGEPDAYFQLGVPSLQETARAYELSPDVGVETLRAVVAESRNEPHWSFPGVPRDQWDLRLVAGGRMVECIAADWEPILRSVTGADGGAFDIPLYLGRLGGRLQVLR